MKLFEAPLCTINYAYGGKYRSPDAKATLERPFCGRDYPLEEVRLYYKTAHDSVVWYHMCPRPLWMIPPLMDV